MFVRIDYLRRKAILKNVLSNSTWNNPFNSQKTDWLKGIKASSRVEEPLRTRD